jgi:hypothetical protein
MIIARKYEVPDKCPENCKFKNDILNYGQNAICGRCPVFVCEEPRTEEDKMYMPLVPADEYRDDWAEEWEKFFKERIDYPELKLFAKRRMKDVSEQTRVL